MFSEVVKNVPAYSNLAMGKVVIAKNSETHKKWVCDKFFADDCGRIYISTFKREGEYELAEVYDMTAEGAANELIYMAAVTVF
jgi:hypothetical protein